METRQESIPVLQPGEKIIGSAYLTADGEIVFDYHPDSLEVALVEPQAGCSGPWAIRLRPQRRMKVSGAAGA